MYDWGVAKRRAELDKMEAKGVEESERAKEQRKTEEDAEAQAKEVSKRLKLLTSELKLLQATCDREIPYPNLLHRDTRLSQKKL